MTTAQLTKDEARRMVEDFCNLPYVHPKNAAATFVKNIEWHPRWLIVFEILAEVKAEYEKLLPIREEIIKAVKSGSVTKHHDASGGWSWEYKTVSAGGLSPCILNDGATLRCGQNAEPVLSLID